LKLSLAIKYHAAGGAARVSQPAYCEGAVELTDQKAGPAAVPALLLFATAGS
jgi:hypothetical protein